MAPSQAPVRVQEWLWALNQLTQFGDHRHPIFPAGLIGSCQSRPFLCKWIFIDYTINTPFQWSLTEKLV